jgi:transcription initiation factor TFIID subunit 1
MKKYLYSTKLFITSNTKNNNNMKLNEVEQKTLNMMGPNGVQILLKPEQKLPLLGQIDQNELKGINIIDNNMYKAPVFYEKIAYPNSAINTSLDKKRYNFLITFSKNEKGQKVFHIRELEHLYTVAQEEPKIEVYAPNSKQYLSFLKNKIETYTYMLYNETGYKSGINFKIFQNLFPTVTEQVLKKIFKEMNIEIDKYLCYFKKLPGDINQRRISPENICQFESCQFGIYKLREVGIKNLTNADKISYATNKYINNKTTLPKEQYLAKIIEEQLLTTPWNITQNYLQSKQTKGMLSIKGIGDPSNGNGGYSFLKMPVKSYNENKTLKEEMDVLKNQNKNIKTVTGTDADLRKLSKEEIKIKLIQLGIEEDVIQKMGRWKRVSLLRSTSSHAVKLGYEGDIVKYARNQRYNTKTQREAYQRNINEVFKKQIDYILKAGDSIPLDENESDSENVEDQNMNDITENDQEGMRYNFDEELDNKKRNSMAFMRNEIYPNKKKK